MSGPGDSQLWEDDFDITHVDQSKYDRVARLSATSRDANSVMTLDINTELFPCSVGESLTLMLATSLSLDGSKDDEGKGWRDATKGTDGAGSLADDWDYVCHGKIYKFEDSEDSQVIRVFLSFGGLLMSIEGPYKKLTPLRIDYAYLLVKK